MERHNNNNNTEYTNHYYNTSQDINDTVKSTNDAINADISSKQNRNLRYATEIGGDRHYREDLKQTDRSELYNRSNESNNVNSILGSGMSSYVDINGRVRGYNSKSVRDMLEGIGSKQDQEDVSKFLEQRGIYSKKKINKRSEDKWREDLAKRNGINLNHFTNNGKTRSYDYKKDDNTGWDDDKLKKIGLDHASYQKYLDGDEDADTLEYYDDNNQKVDKRLLGNSIRDFYADRAETSFNNDQINKLKIATGNLDNIENYETKKDEASQDLKRWDSEYNKTKHGFITNFLYNKIKRGMKNQLNTMKYYNYEDYNNYKKNEGIGNKLTRLAARIYGMDTDSFSINDLKLRIHRDYVDFSRRNINTYKPISNSEILLLEENFNTSNKFNNFSTTNNKNPYLNWDVYGGI